MSTIHAAAAQITINNENFSLPQRLAFWTAVLIAGCWLIYFVFAPTLGFGLLDSWHNEQRMVQVVLLLGTALSYLWLLFVVPTARIAGSLWIALGLGALSASLAVFRIQAAVEVALAMSLILLGAFFATLVRHAHRQVSLALFYSALLIGAVYVVGVAANYVGVVVEQRAVDIDVFILGYANPRFASATHALVLPLIAWLAFDRSQKRSLRSASWIVAVLLCAINLALGTRAIWAAILVASIALWWLGGLAARRAVKALGVTAAVGALIYLAAWLFAPSVLPQTGGAFSRVGGLMSWSGRLGLWRAALDSVLAHPWMGIGPMNFAALIDPGAAHPHNWPLQIASEWGLLATLAVFVATYSWCRSIRESLASRICEMQADALPALSLSVLTAVIYGLVDGNWVMPVSQSLAVICVGASLGLLSEQNYPLVRNARNLSSAAMFVLTISAYIILGWYTWKTAGLQTEGDREYTKRAQIQDFLPRFWQQGYLLVEPDE